MNTVIETYALSRRFGNILAVDALDLRVPQGSIYGFLGANGAGKTTTIRMLLGLIRPHAGRVLIQGKALDTHRAAILAHTGSLVEMPSLYPNLTGRENLTLFCGLLGAGQEQIGRALNIVRLENDANRLVRTYSLGMRQRLGLAVAFLGNPSLLILDEPTNGLDPAGIHEIRSLLCNLPRQEGVSIFISSHLLSEVEQMATHIGIINRGRLIFQGTPEQLRTQYHEVLTVQTGEPKAVQQWLQSKGWNVSHNGDHHLSVKINGASDAALINAQIVQAGYPVYQLGILQPSLEDIFLALTETGKPTEVFS